MCGGGNPFKRIVKEINRSIIRPVAEVAGETVGSILGGGKKDTPQLPQGPTTQAVDDLAAKAKADADQKALDRKRAIKKGGRQSTLLAGKVDSTQDAKTKLGQ